MPSPEDLRIGDFSKPLVPKPAKGDSPTKTSLDAAESRLDAAASKDEEALKPLKTYEDKLKAVGLDKTKAAVILDDVMLKGFYSEEIAVTPRVKARLRTRNARDTKRAQTMLEGMRLTYDSHYAESLSRILLASSLEQFGNDQLPHPNRKAQDKDIEDAFTTRMSYVETMPDPALRIMFKRLMEFDQRVAAALEDGAIENF